MTMASVFKAKGASKCTIFYTDENGKRRKKTGYTHKGETMKLAMRLEDRGDKVRDGTIDPKDELYRDHDRRPIADHLDAWFKALEAKGATLKHIELFTGRARRVVAVLAGAKLREIALPSQASQDDVARAEAIVAKAVGSVRLRDLTEERVQAALSTIRRDVRSLGTCNHYRMAIKGFSKWCYSSRRTREYALSGVTGFNAKEDRRHDRRTIALDELRGLVEAAEHGPDVMGMPGPSRAICYRLALATGLRYAEIGSIMPESFD